MLLEREDEHKEELYTTYRNIINQMIRANESCWEKDVEDVRKYESINAIGLWQIQIGEYGKEKRYGYNEN